MTDYCSRHPFANIQENSQYLNNKSTFNFVCKNACPQALTLDDIKQAMKNENTLQKLKCGILEIRLFEIQKILFYFIKNLFTKTLHKNKI